jgi:hypothetical protein
MAESAFAAQPRTVPSPEWLDAVPSPEPLDALFAILAQNRFTATPRQRASAAFIFAQHLAGAGADDLPALKHALSPIFAYSEAQQRAFHRLFDRWANPGVAPEILGDARAVAIKAIVNSGDSETKSRRRFIAAIATIVFLAAIATAALLLDWQAVKDWLFPSPPPHVTTEKPPPPPPEVGKAVDLPAEPITIDRRVVSPFAAPLAWALTLLPLTLLGVTRSGRSGAARCRGRRQCP